MGIRHFIEEGANQELIDVKQQLTDIKTVLAEIKGQSATISLKIDDTTGIKEAMELLKQTAKMKSDLQGLPALINSLAGALNKLRDAQGQSAKQTDAAAIAEQKLSTEREKTRLASAKSEEQERRNAEALEKSTQATRNAEEAERAKSEAQSAANAVAQQSATTFQAEAEALYTSVKAHQEASASLREEAQAKSIAAAQSTDAAEKTRLEVQAKNLLSAAINEEKAGKSELASANKNVSSTVKDNIAAEALLTRELDKLNTAMGRQINEASKQSNAYEILKREYNEAAYATKTLAAEYVILQRSGSATVDQLLKMKQALDAQQKSTLSQSNALLQMEQAVGQNQRSIGNYANATGEITQILRELPNFAISAQTGILSLSNNLPMLQAALSRLAQTVDVNTGKAIGWGGVLKTIAGSIFSLQGLIVLGTTLLVAYHEQIGEVIFRTTDAEKAQNLYNKALEESASKTGEEIGKLILIRDTLSSTTATREQVLEAMERLNKIYPGLFNNLTEENRLTTGVNESIEKQIELIERRAEIDAGNRAIGEASAEMLKAQQELNKETSFFQEIWANTKWLSGAGKSLDQLSESSRRLVNEQYELYKSGAINRNEYHARYYQILELDKAHNVLSETVKRSLDPESKRIELSEKKVKSLQKEIEEAKKLDESYWVDGKGSVSYVKQKQKEIDVISDVIKKLKEEREARLNARPSIPEKTFIEIAKQEAETRAKFAKDNSKEELDEKIKVEKYKFGIAVGQLKKEYAEKYKLRGAERDANAQYIRDFNSLVADSDDAIEKLQEKNAKANKPKKVPKGYDPTNAELKGQEDLNDATNEFAKQRVETEMAANKAIFDNETLSLKSRLDAYEEYVKGQQQLNVIEENGELNAIQIKLDKIKEVEAIDEKKRTSAQKALLLDKEALLVRETTLLEKYRLKSQEINSAAQKKEREIVESNAKYLQGQLNLRYSAIKDQVDAETALRLEALNKQREKGEISERQFWSMRQRVMASESKILFDKEYEFLNNEYKRLIDDPTIPQAVKDTLRKLIGDLEKIRPQPKKAEGMSILQYLGLGTTKNQEEADAALKNLRDVKDKFGEFSQEYQDALSEQQSQNEKTAEDYKKSIAASLKGLYDTLFQAIDQNRENYYKERLDNLDKEKEKIQENAEAEKNAIEMSLLSQDEKTRQLAAIDARRAQDEKANDAQQKALKREQAIREKKDAVFKIEMEGGIAVARALAGAAENPVLAIAAAALIAAQTIANIALINSRPIPEYWKGTDNHPGGPAIVGERGMELVRLMSGHSFLTPSVPTMMDLPRGAQVISNKELSQTAERNAMLEMSRVQGGATPEQYAASMAFNYEQGLKKLGDRFEKGIEKIPITNLYWDNGELKKAVKKGNVSTKFLNRFKGWV